MLTARHLRQQDKAAERRRPVCRIWETQEPSSITVDQEAVRRVKEDLDPEMAERLLKDSTEVPGFPLAEAVARHPRSALEGLVARNSRTEPLLLLPPTVPAVEGAATLGEQAEQAGAQARLVTS